MTGEPPSELLRKQHHGIREEDETSWSEEDQEIRQEHTTSGYTLLKESPQKTAEKFKLSMEDQGQLTDKHASPFKLNISPRRHEIPNSAVTIDRGLRSSIKLQSPKGKILSDETTEDDQTHLALQNFDSPEIKRLQDRLKNLEKTDDTESLRKEARNIKK